MKSFVKAERMKQVDKGVIIRVSVTNNIDLMFDLQEMSALCPNKSPKLDIECHFFEGVVIFICKGCYPKKLGLY